jgi:hypothetical protein
MIKMKYASTLTHAGTERVVVILPLSAVPGFDQEKPPQENTYAVPDEVQIGWIKQAGQFIAPPAPESIIPQIVTRAQFKLALLSLNLLDTVESLVAGSADRALQINWAERLEFDRNHPLVLTTAAALGKTDAEIDALFLLAATK